MKSSHLTLIVVAIVGGMTLGQHEQPAGGKPKLVVVSERDISEKVDGKAVKATTVEVTLEPGQASMPHRHPGPVFGYVLEGDYEWAIDDQPAKKLKTGDTFYEPAMCLHRVSRNLSDKNKARILAVLLVPRDAQAISIPEPAKK
jgi:quercetin dioxygenase-like cupin family protein